MRRAGFHRQDLDHVSPSCEARSVCSLGLESIAQILGGLRTHALCAVHSLEQASDVHIHGVSGEEVLSLGCSRSRTAAEVREVFCLQVHEASARQGDEAGAWTDDARERSGQRSAFSRVSSFGSHKVDSTLLALQAWLVEGI